MDDGESPHTDDNIDNEEGDNLVTCKSVLHETLEAKGQRSSILPHPDFLFACGCLILVILIMFLVIILAFLPCLLLGFKECMRSC